MVNLYIYVKIMVIHYMLVKTCCVFRVVDVFGVKNNHIYHGYMVYVWDSYSGGVILYHSFVNRWNILVNIPGYFMEYVVY